MSWRVVDALLGGNGAEPVAQRLQSAHVPAQAGVDQLQQPGVATGGAQQLPGLRAGQRVQAGETQQELACLSWAEWSHPDLPQSVDAGKWVAGGDQQPPDPGGADEGGGDHGGDLIAEGVTAEAEVAARTSRPSRS